MKISSFVRYKTKAFYVLAAAVFSLAFISCAANDDSASLTIQMPGASSSRAISSEGHLEASDAPDLNFSVYIRDSDNEEVEKYTNVAPGTRLTISSLRPGSYKVAIRGITNGDVMFYGAEDAVVQGGVENTVGIKLREPNKYALIGFPSETSQLVNLITGKITCENGDSFDVNTTNFQYYSSVAASPEQFAVYSELFNFFFEPGFTYHMNIYVNFSDGAPVRNFTSSATATKDGIVFDCN